MTFRFDNVYIRDVATVVGPYESKGPLSKEFDQCTLTVILLKKLK